MLGAEEHLHGEGSPQLPEKPAYMPNPESRMDNMELKTIAELAYQYWEDRGRPVGSPDEDWLRAEHNVKASREWRLQLRDGKTNAHDAP
jgi:hypothetical protein